jgi:hypothetical protein
MASTVAIRCDELTDDLTRLDRVTVKCHQCDEDNPRAVARENCTGCQGTGRSVIKFPSIVREVREARTTPQRGTRGGQDDELFLEY